jgi:hypothetical protein
MDHLDARTIIGEAFAMMQSAAPWRACQFPTFAKKKTAVRLRQHDKLKAPLASS